MIKEHDIKAYLALKSRLADYLTKYPDALDARRDWSEGLAHYIEVDGEEWSYTNLKHGWAFSHQDSGRRLLFHDSAPFAEQVDRFNVKELYEYLSCLPEHEQISPVAIDMWLVNACMRGKISEERGQFALV